jgi:hypothetical protein
MAMDGQRNGHGRNITYHPTRYNSPIEMMRKQSDTRQVLNSHTVATTARIHRWACATSETRSALSGSLVVRREMLFAELKGLP